MSINLPSICNTQEKICWNSALLAPYCKKRVTEHSQSGGGAGYFHCRAMTVNDDFDLYALFYLGSYLQYYTWHLRLMWVSISRWKSGSPHSRRNDLGTNSSNYCASFHVTAWQARSLSDHVLFATFLCWLTDLFLLLTFLK